MTKLREGQSLQRKEGGASPSPTRPLEGGRYEELFGREDFGVGGFGCGRSGNYVESRVDVFGYGGEADFGAAGLVTEFQRDVLGAEGSGGENG
jgi:hypothetical protein